MTGWRYYTELRNYPDGNAHAKYWVGGECKYIVWCIE